MAKHVEFSNPPVVEVVFGALFGTSQPIKLAHIGLFWDKVRGEFPRTEDASPLLPAIERYETTPSFTAVPLSSGSRIWLLSSGGDALLQIQPDRFLFNWKRPGTDATGASYPGFEEVAQRFEDYLRRFTGFLSTEGLGAPTYRQFELAYINRMIPSSDQGSGEHEMFVDHKRNPAKNRFLPTPESFAWSTSYPFPRQAGRLHVVAKTILAPPGMEKFVQLEMIARGMLPGNQTEQSRVSWFEMAHEWIVKGFSDVTSPLLHDRWGRKS
jgi:uncharacterized protein (TIGR04255 family)